MNHQRQDGKPLNIKSLMKRWFTTFMIEGKTRVL